MTLLPLILIASYLLGSIPAGLLISKKMRGIDPRKAGSSNVGATNVWRVVGKREAILTLVCDILKGTVPVVIAQGISVGEEGVLLVGLVAILGHLFPVFMKFRGGKGVATSFGVFLGLMPPMALSALIVWLLGIYLGKASSVGALAAFASLPLLAYWFNPSTIFLLFSCSISTLVYIQHHENIRRILKGIEK